MGWIEILIGLFGGGFGGASISWILSRKKRQVMLDKDKTDVIKSLQEIYKDMIGQTKESMADQATLITEFREELKNNKKEIERCRDDIKLLNKDNRDLHREINSLRKENGILKERIFELEKDNNRKAQENLELKARIKKLTPAQGNA